MNTNKPNDEFDLWLLRNTWMPNATMEDINQIDWSPTSDLHHAMIAAKAYFLKCTTGIIEITYNTVCEIPHVVVVQDDNSEYRVEGWGGIALPLTVCKALALAITEGNLERMSTGRQKE